MERARIVLGVGIVFALSVSPALAQHEGHGHAAGDEEVGVVHFPTSCEPSAQPTFDRAVAMLHSFWYEEAEKTFRAAAAADPRCAMAWWGVAMSLYHPIWPDKAPLDAGLAAVEKARAIGARTEREKAYIEAIGAYYAPSAGADYELRARTFEKAMERLHAAFPNDREGAAFYALSLLWTLSYAPADQTNPRKAAAVLDRIAAEMPDHPGVLHYSIHAYDSPSLASLALNAARRYAKVAPAVPHALHMPSHIFTRLGLWQESIDSNVAAAAASKEFERREHMPGAWDERLHALDYLEYAYLQRGDDAKAEAVVAQVRRIGRVQPESLKAAYPLAAVPARYAVEGGRWTDAAALELSPPEFPWKRFGIAEGIRHFARALGAARTGDSNAARREIEALATLRDEMRGGQGYDWSGQIEILRLESEGGLAQTLGRPEEALSLLRRAADQEDAAEKNSVTPGPVVPAREQLADLLSEQGRFADALPEYERALTIAPNRFNALLGAARAARSSGRAENARELYRRLLAVSDPATARPGAAEAKAFIESPAASPGAVSGKGALANRSGGRGGSSARLP